jgi:hypothetical protein
MRAMIGVHPRDARDFNNINAMSDDGHRPIVSGGRAAAMAVCLECPSVQMSEPISRPAMPCHKWQILRLDRFDLRKGGRKSVRLYTRRRIRTESEREISASSLCLSMGASFVPPTD